MATRIYRGGAGGTKAKRVTGATASKFRTKRRVRTATSAVKKAAGGGARKVRTTVPKIKTAAGSAGRKVGNSRPGVGAAMGAERAGRKVKGASKAGASWVKKNPKKAGAIGGGVAAVGAGVAIRRRRKAKKAKVQGQNGKYKMKK